MLSAKAKEILKIATDAGQGQGKGEVALSQNDLGPSLIVGGGKIIDPLKDPDHAEWIAAFKELDSGEIRPYLPVWRLGG